MGAGAVIVGTGQAGFQTAASLRTEGYAEPITLIGEESEIPYQRPPLSKGFALGQQDLESIQFRPEGFYRDHRIELLASQRVTWIDPAARHVTLQTGREIAYEKLVLAVGSRNRKLRVPGGELDGVIYLRSLEEAVAARNRLSSANEVVVIGGGFIGLEMAAVARTLGKEVTVLEALPRLMSRAVPPIISEFYRQLHASKGVNVVCDATVAQIEGSNGKVQNVLLHSGSRLSADLIIVGIGVVPNIELAHEAALPTANGIVVDEYLQTGDENIFAIGDCVEFPCAFAAASIRLESVQNAADQAQCVARTIAGGRSTYKALPWFWTDQYGIKLQMAGISQGYDRVVTRGNAEARKLSVFYFKGDRLIAIDSINRPLDHMLGRKLMAAGARITFEEAADESVDLKKLAQSASGAPH